MSRLLEDVKWVVHRNSPLFTVLILSHNAFFLLCFLDKCVLHFCHL